MGGTAQHANLGPTRDTLNQRIVDRINTAGRYFLSHTRLRDAYAIRVAFGNVRQEPRHARGVITALRSALDDDVG